MSVAGVPRAVAVSVHPAHEARRVAYRGKRAIDFGVAPVLLVASLPLMALIGLSVLICMGRPVLFRQERIGRGGRSFRLVKFRSMIRDAECLAPLLATKSADDDWLALACDPRVTSLGRGLRKLSLDELPQLWNVVRGEMSLVGPRPLSVADAANVPPWARGRTVVAPGLTGPWQVNGRTDLLFRQMLDLDLAYVRDCCLRGDVALLLRTVPAVLCARGAN